MPTEVADQTSLDSLPRLAVAAFAARCARRVQPLLQAFSPTAHAGELERLGNSIDAAEEFAIKGLLNRVVAHEVRGSAQVMAEAIGDLKVEANAVFAAAAAEWALDDPPRHATEVVREALIAGWLPLGFPYGSKQVGFRNSFAVAEVAREAGPFPLRILATLAALPMKATEWWPQFRRAVSEDFTKVSSAAREGEWGDSTPVSAAFFGPFWPHGVPASWPGPVTALGGRGVEVVEETSLPHCMPGAVGDRLGSVESPEDTIARLGDEIDEAHKPIIARLQKVLDSLEGQALESFEANQRIAAVIQSTVARLGMAIVCPKDGCGKPAKLRCKKPGRSKDGAFVFEHQEDGKQVFHGGKATLPALHIVPQN